MQKLQICHSSSLYLVVSCLEFDKQKVISGSGDKTLRIWSIKTGSCLKVLKGHTEDVVSGYTCIVYILHSKSGFARLLQKVLHFSVTA